MLTRTLANRRTALLAGLFAGLTGQAASATDVVIAYGDHAVQQAREMDAEFRARLNQGARNVDLAIRQNVEREVTRIKAPATVQLALADSVKRG